MALSDPDHPKPKTGFDLAYDAIVALWRALDQRVEAMLDLSQEGIEQLLKALPAEFHHDLRGYLEGLARSYPIKARIDDIRIEVEGVIDALDFFSRLRRVG